MNYSTMKRLNLDQQRQLLTQRRQEYKNAIATSLEETTTAVSNKLQAVAFGVGALLLGYLIVKGINQLTEKETPKKTSSAASATESSPPPRAESRFSIIDFFKEQLALLLMSFVKDKLYQLLEVLIQSLSSNTQTHSASSQEPQKDEAKT